MAVYSVYRVQRNAIGFQERFPCSSFAELAKLFGVFIGKSLFVSLGFESIDPTVVGYSFSHKTISTKKYGILCRTSSALLHKNCHGAGGIHLRKQTTSPTPRNKFDDRNAECKDTIC